MTSLPQRHGSAKRPDRLPARRRPAAISDPVVSALGKLSEALEIVEQARGALYEFHRLSGTADLTLQRAVDDLREAGQANLADEIAECLVGRDVIDDKWTFQLVEAYDCQYWQVFRDVEHFARKRFEDAPQHLVEAEMKWREQQ